MKRLLSLFLALVMVTCLIPITVSAEDLPQLAAPTDLEWGFDHVIETSVPGSISWRSVEPSQNYFLIDLYQVGESEPYHRSAWITSFPLDGGWNTSYVVPSIDLESGNYYFTVTSYNTDDTYTPSEPVTSDTWNYTRPSAKLGTYSNLHWGENSEYLYYDEPADTTYLRGCEIGYFYAATEDVEPEYYGGEIDLNDYPYSEVVYHSFYEGLEHYGDGYYYFAIRALSSDITVICNGDWSEYSNALYYVNGEFVTEPAPPATEPTLSTLTGTYTTDLVMSAADLGVSAPDSVLRATLTFGEDGNASCTWEAVDLTAFRIFFHDMFVNAYYAMAYGAGITDLNEIEQFCIDSTGMSVSAYMDTLVTDEAMRESFTPASTRGTYSYNADHTAIFTNLSIMDVPSDPSVENSFVIGGDTLYLNAASWEKPDYTFVCTRK